MSSPLELKVNRTNTDAFINVKPTEITLKPQTRIKTSTGGFQIAYEAPRAPQQFRIIDSSSSYLPDQPPQRTIDGIERTVEFILLGSYDAQMALFDIWTDADGAMWELTSVFPDNGYERRALVVRHAD